MRHASRTCGWNRPAPRRRARRPDRARGRSERWLAVRQSREVAMLPNASVMSGMDASSATKTTAQSNEARQHFRGVMACSNRSVRHAGHRPLHRGALRELVEPGREARARRAPVDVGEAEVEIAQRAADGDLAEIDVRAAGVAEHVATLAFQPVEAAVDFLSSGRRATRASARSSGRSTFSYRQIPRLRKCRLASACTVSTSQRRAPDVGNDASPPWQAHRGSRR